MSEKVNIVFSFDTTGSMYPCLAQARQNIELTVKRMMKDIPGLRVGIISHGDYCDGPNMIHKLDLTDNVNDVVKFVQNAPATAGGDAAECYELVLHEARSFTWDSGATKVLVVIGDDVPHSAHEKQNFKSLDWRNEIRLLLESGINVYGVQALRRGHATSFYKEIAKETGGFHLELDQFSAVVDLLFAICYKQQGAEALSQFEKEIVDAGRMNRQNDAIFSTLTGRAKTFEELDSYRSAYDASAGYYKPSTKAKSPSSRPVGSVTADFSKVDTSLLEPVSPSRFQVMAVAEDCSILEYVQKNGLTFQKGKGFYQHTESVKVQDHKEIVLVDKKSGDMFTGAAARTMLGLPETGTVNLRMGSLPSFFAYIQSTSINRKLLKGTNFLYEVDMTR